MTSIDPVFVRPKVACEITGLSPRDLARKLQLGEIPSTLDGRKRLIPYRWLVEWADRVASGAA